MKVTEAAFVRSYFKIKDLPQPGLPEIAFAGRSNVGKSSLINKLLHRNGIAKTSSTPGRTQSINFIQVNEACFMVDLPGYGYAKVPLSVKQQWSRLIDGYLQQRGSLKLLVLIVDSRRQPTEEEKLFAQWMDLHNVPYVLVLTKIDKLKSGMRAKSCRCWQDYMNMSEIVQFSALSGEGKDKLWRLIDEAIKR